MVSRYFKVKHETVTFKNTLVSCKLYITKKLTAVYAKLQALQNIAKGITTYKEIV